MNTTHDDVLKLVPLMNILTGVLMAAASWPLIKGKVAPNRTYGIRTKLAFSSEENWYKVNRRGGTLLFRIAFPIVIVGIVGFGAIMDCDCNPN